MFWNRRKNFEDVKFQQMAKAMEDIYSEEKIPILVGGIWILYLRQLQRILILQKLSRKMITVEGAEALQKKKAGSISMKC